MLKRIERLKPLLQACDLDALFLQDPLDLFYFTGISLSTGTLLLLPEGAHLFVDSRYEEIARKNSPIPVILWNRDRSLMKEICTRWPALVRIGFDGDLASWNSVFNWKKSAPKLEFVPLQSPSKPLRMIKDADEVICLKEAAQIACRGLEAALPFLRTGITEKEFSWQLELAMRALGATGTSFETIIAFGAHASMPHYHPQNTRLEEGMGVLIDFGAVWKHYCSDMTRVVFFKECSEKWQAIYKAVLEVQQQAITLCRPGAILHEIEQEARAHLIALDYGDYFNHGLGHGIGLEVHEAPSFKEARALEPGMVITIEPGVYLPQFGGVRIEDMVLITESGCEILTPFTKEIVVV
jgi:Xaa-Pro aminopeptidase